MAHLIRRYEVAKVLLATELLDCDGDLDELALDSPAFLAFLNAKSILDKAKKSRYFKKRTSRKYGIDVFEKDLAEPNDSDQWMTNDEF